MSKIITFLVLMIASLSYTLPSGYVDYVDQGIARPSVWSSVYGWNVDANGYIAGAPVQIADLPSDPENSTSRNINLDTGIPANLNWIYRWRMTPKENATHTPFRRLNFESVRVITADYQWMNYVGPLEGPNAFDNYSSEFEDRDDNDTINPGDWLFPKEGEDVTIYIPPSTPKVIPSVARIDLDSATRSARGIPSAPANILIPIWDSLHPIRDLLACLARYNDNGGISWAECCDPAVY